MGACKRMLSKKDVRGGSPIRFVAEVPRPIPIDIPRRKLSKSATRGARVPLVQSARRSERRGSSVFRRERTFFTARLRSKQLVKHPVEGDIEFFGCFVDSGGDLAANLIHALLANLG